MSLTLQSHCPRITSYGHSLHSRRACGSAPHTDTHASPIYHLPPTRTRISSHFAAHIQRFVTTGWLSRGCSGKFALVYVGLAHVARGHSCCIFLTPSCVTPLTLLKTAPLSLTLPFTLTACSSRIHLAHRIKRSKPSFMLALSPHWLAYSAWGLSRYVRYFSSPLGPYPDLSF
jgi:hypothetical protein